MNRKDHPRMCGEKCLSWLIVADVAGSPPHVRGKVTEWPQNIHEYQDHPRMCGEKDNTKIPGNGR